MLICNLARPRTPCHKKGYKKRTPFQVRRAFCYRIARYGQNPPDHLRHAAKPGRVCGAGAAAMVIAELRPKQDVVIKALGASLKDANQTTDALCAGSVLSALDSRAVSRMDYRCWRRQRPKAMLRARRDPRARAR